MVINVIRDTAPEITHECPYNGFIKVTNLTMDLSKVLSVYPQGDYRSHWLISDDMDEKIFLLRIYGTVKSSVKNSWR
ncbi:unnamed protein product [Diamesa tonsa]